MSRIRDFAVVGVMAAVMLAPTLAAADTKVTATFTGQVAQISDPSGLLGSAKAGDPYVLTYQIDLSDGTLEHGNGGLGGSASVTGGGSNPLGLPAAQMSPLSATLNIDGHSLMFSGADLGAVDYTYDAYGTIFGGTGESWATFEARDVSGSLVSSDIRTSISSNVYQTFDDITQSATVAVDGVDVTGSSTFSFGDASGTLGAAAVSSAPEPATWALMILGLGLAGAALRFSGCESAQVQPRSTR